MDVYISYKAWDGACKVVDKQGSKTVIVKVTDLEFKGYPVISQFSVTVYPPLWSYD